jgi:hypothetical protein
VLRDLENFHPTAAEYKSMSSAGTGVHQRAARRAKKIAVTLTPIEVYDNVRQDFLAYFEALLGVFIAVFHHKRICESKC